MKDTYETNERVVMNYPGPMGGPGYVSRNAMEIEIVHHINGGGEGAFGGAEEWPCIHVKIPFPAGAEARAVKIAQSIAKWIAITFDPYGKLGNHEWEVTYRKGYQQAHDHDKYVVEE
jgi:hypothetical protein